MKIGAYQFAITSDINHNFDMIKKAVIEAYGQGVKLIVFPECSLTGYPPRDIESSAQVDYEALNIIYNHIQVLADKFDIYIIVGSITQAEDQFFNSAIVFSPYKDSVVYNKRALWGWDRDNFTVGNANGIVEIDGWKIGIRICFEVRFPEFFRELYKENTDLNVIMFYDVADFDDEGRYELIKSHIRTRAVENATYTLSVDSISPFQTAPTALYDRSGSALVELNRNKESLLVFELEKSEPDFGEQGRIEISNTLIKS